MNVSDFDFELPEDRIAQEPAPERAGSRMLVLDRAAGSWSDAWFRELPQRLGAGDRLVLNNSRVLPLRLHGRRAHGEGLVETLLVKRISEEPLLWEALVRPGRKMRTGERIDYPGGLAATIVGRGEYGLRTLEFAPVELFAGTLERIGRTPLPPYIKRTPSDEDRRRYQTVYASQPGSAAAPTAGLHFDEPMLEALRAEDVSIVEITLHVGLGTFQPVRTDRVEEHRLHGERFEIGAEAAAALAGPGRTVAVGTTCVRTLEHAIRAGGGRILAGEGETDLFIYPGFEFQAVWAMLTNFHLPRSTLLMLVCAFAGADLTLAAYRHAVEAGYRFYSYGDCMLIV